MDKIEQFDFLKNYYNLLKSKDASNIGGRFMNQAKQLAAAGEIDTKVLAIISACIAIGQEMGKDVTDEDFELIKQFITIGVEMKEERNANKLADTIVNYSQRGSGNPRNTSSNYDPCSSSLASRNGVRC